MIFLNMCIIITKFKKLQGSVNAEEFISIPHGLKRLLKQDQLQFSMPRVLSAFPQRREILIDTVHIQLNYLTAI